MELAHQALSDDDLLAKTAAEFRAVAGRRPDPRRHPARGVRRLPRRGPTLPQDAQHYDVQLMGGMVLHGGASPRWSPARANLSRHGLAAYLNALEGKGVQVVTVNDYLARRDAEWMSPLYNAWARLSARSSRTWTRRATGHLRPRHHLWHYQRVRLRIISATI